MNFVATIEISIPIGAETKSDAYEHAFSKMYSEIRTLKDCYIENIKLTQTNSNKDQGLKDG